MKKHPTLPLSVPKPTDKQLEALIALAKSRSREEIQRMLRAPRTRGPLLVPFGEKPSTILKVTRDKHPSEIVRNCPGLVTGHGPHYLFGSPPNGDLDLLPTRGFYQLCRPADGKIPEEPGIWDWEAHLANLQLAACDIWDLLAWYQHIGQHVDRTSLPADWRVVTTTNHGFNESGHYYWDGAQFWFAFLYLVDGRWQLGFNQYPTSYCHDAWTDNAYILGRHDVKANVRRTKRQSRQRSA
jgi:hypothetical protein